MNFKYVFGFLSLICAVSQASAWNWGEVSELNQALQENKTFLGKDVTKMNDDEKEKICTDAYPKLSSQNVILDQIITLSVGVISDGNHRTREFSVFSCNGKPYFFGIGPRKNTIAVYTEKNQVGVPYGIMSS